MEHFGVISLLLLILTFAILIGIEIWGNKQDKKTHKKLDTLVAIIAKFSKTDEQTRAAIRHVKEQGMTLPPNLANAI